MIKFLTFSYINILGFLSFIVFLLQLSSGILSSIYYNDFFTIASDSIIYIIININNGWFIRILHVIGASLFILLILLLLHLNITFHSMLSLNSSGIYCAIFIPLSHLIKLLHYYNYSITMVSIKLFITISMMIGNIIDIYLSGIILVLINYVMYSGYFGLILCSYLLYLFLTRIINWFWILKRI